MAVTSGGVAQDIADNLRNWNDRAVVHTNGVYGDINVFVEDESALSHVVLRDMAVLESHLPDRFVRGLKLLHLQCHIGTDTLTWWHRQRHDFGGRSGHGRGVPPILRWFSHGLPSAAPPQAGRADYRRRFARHLFLGTGDFEKNGDRHYPDRHWRIAGRAECLGACRMYRRTLPTTSVPMSATDAISSRQCDHGRDVRTAHGTCLYAQSMP